MINMERINMKSELPVVNPGGRSMIDIERIDRGQLPIDMERIDMMRQSPIVNPDQHRGD